MRENLKTKSFKYILLVIFLDDLYIASPIPEEILNILQDKYKIQTYPDSYLAGSCHMTQVEQ